MKKILLFIILLSNFYLTSSSNIIYENKIEDDFLTLISSYQSYNQNLYNLYLKEYQKENNIIYALNKVNHPNFFTSTKKIKSFSFDGGIFINKNYFLDESYIPKNLVPVTVNKIIRNGEAMLADEKATIAITSLFNEAEKNDLNLVVYSAYRSYQKQKILYDKSNNKNYVAKEGHSEHQTGLAFDISTLDAGLTNHFFYRKEYLFLSNNAYKYGFIERYKEEKESITNYPAEVWHFRYVGFDIAKKMHEENLSLEEYIYQYVELI